MKDLNGDEECRLIIRKILFTYVLALTNIDQAIMLAKLKPKEKKKHRQDQKR